MREIQELTMQAVAEATRIEATISGRREKFLVESAGWFNRHGGAPGAGLQILGLPTIPIDLVRVVGRPRLTDFASKVIARFAGAPGAQCVLPWRPMEWRPALRSIVGIGQRPETRSSYTLHTTGMCELEFVFKAADQRSGAFVGWFLAALGFMLAWMERIRSEAGIPVEFACAIQIQIFNQPLLLAPYGAQSFVESNGVTLPLGVHEFPLISVGVTDEFPMILQRFDEDLWNLAGYDVQREAPSFSIELSP
jgi:hypothetical protein